MLVSMVQRGWGVGNGDICLGGGGGTWGHPGMPSTAASQAMGLNTHILCHN